MQSTIYYQKRQTKKLHSASKLTEKLLSVLEEEEFAMFERRSLEALKLMLNAFGQRIKAYEEQEHQG